jgi:CheY-like chemotaxis protein
LDPCLADGGVNGVKTSVLIIDDEKDVCEVLKEILEHESCEVDIALTGAEAIARLQQSDYDILLVDIRLDTPVSGIDVIRHCRDMPKLPKIFVISAISKSHLNSLFGQEGVSDLIVQILEKPSDTQPDRFTAILNRSIHPREGGNNGQSARDDIDR